jgi:hypothetical protein
MICLTTPVSNSDYIESNDRIIYEEGIGKDMDGSDRRLI